MLSFCRNVEEKMMMTFSPSTTVLSSLAQGQKFSSLYIVFKNSRFMAPLR